MDFKYKQKIIPVTFEHMNWRQIAEYNRLEQRAWEQDYAAYVATTQDKITLRRFLLQSYFPHNMEETFYHRAELQIMGSASITMRRKPFVPDYSKEVGL